MSQIKRFMQLFYHICPPLSREEKLEQIDCIDAKWLTVQILSLTIRVISTRIRFCKRGV